MPSFLTDQTLPTRVFDKKSSKWTVRDSKDSKDSKDEHSLKLGLVCIDQACFHLVIVQVQAHRYHSSRTMFGYGLVVLCVSVFHALCSLRISICKTELERCSRLSEHAEPM